MFGWLAVAIWPAIYPVVADSTISHYKTLSRLAGRGMGVVYKAEEETDWEGPGLRLKP